MWESYITNSIINSIVSTTSLVKKLLKELTTPEIDTDSVKELMLCLDPQSIINVLNAFMGEQQVILISQSKRR